MIICTIAGRLTRDAELRTAGETAVLNFTVAVDSGYGERKQTLFFGCALWGTRGEKLEDYLTKGKAVTVSGELGTRAYVSREGKDKTELTLRVTDVALQGSTERAPVNDTAPPYDMKAAEQREKDARAALQKAGAATDADFDDDIPF
jgi:single-strand DNA-binding protein